ncbi:hypothetical protein DLAC_07133 [Tieghemostelium lacteum]|uniref:Uncharacterized protein n=1 Tax=Tieghemostelium lacteum TaxID=361077 RepID=A0A151ZE94_TIELA|nr:hypothetical protein DLAC_07133 [Tieghemostelium lacteum]|eukprot:KYQ92282.1 hypothetical protein DLAC_07133 [Tieghemostelium lacteum]
MDTHQFNSGMSGNNIPFSQMLPQQNQQQQQKVFNSTGGTTSYVLGNMGLSDSMIKDMKHNNPDDVTLINFALSAQGHSFMDNHDETSINLLNSTDVLDFTHQHHSLQNQSDFGLQQPQQQQQQQNQLQQPQQQQQQQQQQNQFNQMQNSLPFNNPLNQSASSMYLNKSMDNSSGYYNNSNELHHKVPSSNNQNQSNTQSFNFNTSLNGHNNLFSVPQSPQMPQVENGLRTSNFINFNAYNDQQQLPPIQTHSEPSSPLMQDISSPPTSTTSSSSHLPKYQLQPHQALQQQYQMQPQQSIQQQQQQLQYHQQQQQQQFQQQQIQQYQQQQQKPITNPFSPQPVKQQPQQQNQIQIPQNINTSSMSINSSGGSGPLIQIVDNHTQPFPIYTVKTHVLVPAPVLKVVNYQGDANDLMIIANPDPDDSIVISQPAVTCSDGSFEFKFSDMHVDRKKHDPCNNFRLKFNLLNRKTFERFHEITSNSIELFYHTDMLPAPHIARLVPNSCYCSEETEVTVYGYYFKKGRSEILHVDFTPKHPSPEHKQQTIKQEDLHMPSQTSFSFSFPPPRRSTPGVYSVSARYTKTTTKKEKGTKNKVGNQLPFIYNQLPEGSTKRLKKTTLDNNGSQGADDELENNGYQTPNNMMMGSQPSSPPTSSNSSPSHNYYNQYCYALIHQEVEDLTALLQNKSTKEINEITDLSGNTLVMVAAKEGRDDMLDYLIELGVDMTLLNHTGHNVFHMACYSGSISCVESLVDLGEDFYDSLLTGIDSVGANALHIAVERGHYRLIQYLFNNDFSDSLSCKKDKFGLTPFHYAVQDGNQRISSLFIRHYQEVDKSQLNASDFSGMTPLHWAAALGRLAICQQLLECDNVNVNICDGDNETPIFKSIVTNNKEITKLLVAGSDSSILNNHQKSYIDLLAEQKQQETENLQKEQLQEQLSEQKQQQQLTQTKVITTPRSSSQVTKGGDLEVTSTILNQFQKLNITTTTTPGGDFVQTPGNISPTMSGKPIKDQHQLTKFESFKPTPGDTFIPTLGGDEIFSWTPRDITVDRFEILVNRIELTLKDNQVMKAVGEGSTGTSEGVTPSSDKTKKLTTLLQQSFSDKFTEWMNCEDELLKTKRNQMALEEELSVKAHEIIKLNDFISMCPVEMTQLKENVMGLFILKKERYYGFHQSDTLVIVSNDSMQAIKKIYGNQMPSCLLANILFIAKTNSTKPSQLLPVAGTEFYVVDIEVQKQKGIITE